MLTNKCSQVLCTFCYILSKENIMKTYFCVQCSPIYETTFLRRFPGFSGVSFWWD